MNSIALVTGGNRGLGRAISLELASRGVDVVFTYRQNEGEAHGVVEEIDKLGRKAVALRLDLAAGGDFASFAEATRAALTRTWKRDRFDFLVHNAGFASPAAITETTPALLDELYAVHLRGPFLLTQALLPLLNDGGRIVTVSTALTRFTYPGQSAYAAMKGGLEVFTRYLARELGPRRITANVVAPGGVETDIGGGMMKNADVQAYVASQTALGRVAVPRDVGGVVAALLAPETGWINGQRIELTGGFNL